MKLSSSNFLELVAGRRGHFLLESGYHGGLWLDLDPLFADARRIAPFVSTLTDALRPHAVEVVCGALLGGAFLGQLVAQSLGVKFCFTERVLSPESSELFAARYRLSPAFSDVVRGRRVAIVDDIMSAGSALRGTYAELRTHGANVVVAGSLLQLGTKGADFFAQQGVAVEAPLRDAYELWLPAECPHCASGVPLERLVAGT